MARLPEDLVEATVEKMAIGEVGYTVPWAMWVDEQRQCWLHPQYSIHEKPGGTVEMKVERRIDGFHVWVAGLDFKWNPISQPGYFGGAGPGGWIPVAELHNGDEDSDIPSDSSFRDLVDGLDL